MWRPVAALWLKFDCCNSLLSPVHTLLINILRCVRLYIKQKYYYYYYCLVLSHLVLYHIILYCSVLSSAFLDLRIDCTTQFYPLLFLPLSTIGRMVIQFMTL